MILTKIVAGARRFAESGNFRALLVSAGVAAGIVQLQTLAAEANDTMEKARAVESMYASHRELLQAQISDLEGQALESVRAAIMSGVYDDAVQARVEALQRAAATLAREHNEQHQKTPYPGCPRCASDPAPLSAASWAAAQPGTPMAACGQPFPCEHAPDGGNHPDAA